MMQPIPDSSVAAGPMTVVPALTPERAGADAAKPVGAPLPLAVGAALFISCALIAALRQRAWEYPVIRVMNAYADHSVLLDRLMHALTTRDLLQGVTFISVLWYLWFSTDNPSDRAGLVTGIVAASCAGIVSRVLQLVLPTHLRPLHTPALGFVLPLGVTPDALNHFNSFPSDHGAVFFALSFVIYRMQPRLGVIAFAWATVLDVARVYEGYHFPSDIVGSIGLGLVMVILFDSRGIHHAARRVIAWEPVRRAPFYMLAFLLTYQVATLFDDVRELGRGFARAALHKDIFSEPDR
jgi:membrane-associated phospholipid phosphatase